eukprot:270219_1
MTILSHVIYLFVSYIVMSICECLYHRYAMHVYTSFDVCKRHIIHHALTNYDMTVRKGETKQKYEQFKLEKYEEYHAVYLLWDDTIQILFVFVIIMTTTNYVLSSIFSLVMIWNVSYANAACYGVIYCVCMNAVWNYIHPEVHYMGRLTINEGIDFIPRYNWLRSTALYQCLWTQHTLHHLCTGKAAGNYNLTFIGADWLLGTYRSHCDGYKLDPKNRKIYKQK